MNSVELFDLVDRFLIFFAAIVYICISPPLVHVSVVSDDTIGSSVSRDVFCSTVMIPMETLVCFLYTALVYMMVKSTDMLIKSAGYGAAVAPILVFAEINSY